MLETKCAYCEKTDVNCGCLNPSEYILCKNLHRNNEINSRFDGARNHLKIKNNGYIVPFKYCNKFHCIDYKEGKVGICKFSNILNRKWSIYSHCYVVECRNKKVVNDKNFYFTDKNGTKWDISAIRKPCDENFKLIETNEYLHVRSRFCNKESCKYFEGK